MIRLTDQVWACDSETTADHYHRGKAAGRSNRYGLNRDLCRRIAARYRYYDRPCRALYLGYARGLDV